MGQRRGIDAWPSRWLGHDAPLLGHAGRIRGGDMRPGRNSICAMVEADTAGFFPVDGGAFAALIRLHRADGSIERIVSNADWRVRPGPPAGWTAPEFDAAAWDAAQPSGANVRNDPRPSEPAMLLRTDFEVPAPVVRARLYATALGAYEARINGRPVSGAILAPEISVASDHVLYQCYDVGHLIERGGNTLAAMVGDGWYASPFGWRVERYGFGPAPRRFRAQLRLDHADGSRTWIATGPRLADRAVTDHKVRNLRWGNIRRSPPAAGLGHARLRCVRLGGSQDRHRAWLPPPRADLARAGADGHMPRTADHRAEAGSVRVRFRPEFLGLGPHPRKGAGGYGDHRQVRRTAQRRWNRRHVQFAAGRRRPTPSSSPVRATRCSSRISPITASASSKLRVFPACRRWTTWRA